MSDLLGNNLFYLYFFACLIVMNYSAFGKYQKIFIIYLITFGMNFLGLEGTRVSLALLLSVLFLYEEYLNDDKEKLMLITRLRYKIIDCIYYAVFQYDIFWVLMALLFNSNLAHSYVEQYTGEYMSLICKTVSLLFFFVGLHRLSSKSFELNSFKSMMDRFEQFAFRYIPFEDDELMERLTLITEVEDKSFFARENTYNWISREFISYKLHAAEAYGEGGATGKGRRLLGMLRLLVQGFQKSLKWRGYSTIEMQLIKILGIKRGHYRRKYVVRRKIYELVYSTIFFKGLKFYYSNNQYKKEVNFKAFILYVYLYTVPTKINGKRFERFADAFHLEDKETDSRDIIVKLPLEALFVACLGLNSRDVYYERILLYQWIIDKHLMSFGSILDYAWMVGRIGYLEIREAWEEDAIYVSSEHEFTMQVPGFEIMSARQRQNLIKILKERTARDNFSLTGHAVEEEYGGGFAIEIKFLDDWTTDDVNMYMTRIMSELGYQKIQLVYG